MTTPVVRQLDAIHSMLAVGHRNLRIERHSLLLWGIPAGILFAISDRILTPEQVPALEQRALAWLALIAVVLTAVGSVDWWWTRRVKEARDEAWSFIHRQVQKVWWLLMGLATLCTFGMFFFGGGYMITALWLVCVGLGLYLHGLFSEELLEWVGITIILVGIGSLFAQLPYETMRWIAAATFGFGLPLLALMLDRGCHRAIHFRFAQLLGWLFAVLALPLWLEGQAQRAVLPEQAAISLEEFQRKGSVGNEPVIVNLPAGTRVPVEVDVAGDIFVNSAAILPLTLARPLEVLMIDGKLTANNRFPGEAWQAARQARWISIPYLKAELTPDKGPFVSSKLIVQLRQP
jgi:hypothetical protein